MSKKKEEKDSPTEELLSRIKHGSRRRFNIKKDKIKKAFKMVPNMIAQTEFVKKRGKNAIFVGDQLTATLKMPGELPEKQKIVYFLNWRRSSFDGQLYVHHTR